MKNVISAIIVLIIVGAAIALVCYTRDNAFEHYACASANTAVPATADAVAIDYPNRTATVTGGAYAGVYKGVNITADEVTWQGRAEFTFNRRNGRLTVMRNEQNVVNISAAQCEPAGLYDRFVTMVN